MTKAWDRIQPEFRSYLVKVGYEAKEFNDPSCNRAILFNAFEQHLQQQQQQCWYMVSGVISRPSTHAGARYELFKLAAGSGLYPQNMDADTAFVSKASETEEDRSLISFSVVFTDGAQTAQFVDAVLMYLQRNEGELVLLGDNLSKAESLQIEKIPPFQELAVLGRVMKSHYKPLKGETGPGSPIVGVIMEERSTDFTADVSLLSTHDDTFLFHRIENDTAFALAAPESAHIVPSALCSGEYEWLDTPDFNRLALSRDFHLNFDGTGRGRGKRRKTMQTFAIRPERPAQGYATGNVGGRACYRIPLVLVLNVNEKAGGLLSKLRKSVKLNKPRNSRWTITGTDLHIHHPLNQRVNLVTEETDSGPGLVTAIPGVIGLEDLRDCWSYQVQEGSHSLEASEILEKCLQWNHDNALEKWRVA